MEEEFIVVALLYRGQFALHADEVGVLGSTPLIKKVGEDESGEIVARVVYDGSQKRESQRIVDCIHTRFSSFLSSTSQRCNNTFEDLIGHRAEEVPVFPSCARNATEFDAIVGFRNDTGLTEFGGES